MSRMRGTLAAAIVSTSVLVAAGVTLGLVASAGAAPASGSIVPTAAQPHSPFTAGIPFASGQSISVVIPANSAFASPDNFAGINIVECAAPNGVIPTQTSVCDGNTIQGSTILPAADGSFTYTAFQLFALPDSVTLQELPGGVPCGQTAATECILYIGNNQGDFTKPHLWSAPFFIAPNSTDSGSPAGDGSPPSVVTKQPTTLSTSLSGGGQSGASISVPTATAVTDTATLSGTNAASAGGTVTYNVYSDSGCTTLAPGGGGTAQTITTPGSLPASAAVTLSSAGPYYWGVSYSGDSSNQASSSTCGTAGEVETVSTTVTKQPTTLSTSLSGGGQSGASISVPTATAVTDTATLSGTNAASAGGTVTYNVYSDSGCTTLAPGGGGTAQTITTPGSLPASAAVTLSSAGPYYWGVSYSGDSSNQASSSTCGTAGEVETVSTTVTKQPTTLSTSLSGGGQSGASISVPTATAVTDTATLSGTNAASAGGTVTYNVYSDSGCTTLAPGGGGTAQTITTPGSLPASAAVTLSSAGPYYWGVSYSGDSSNQASSSTCGTAGEVETVSTTVTKQPTTLSTSLSGGGQSGASISVPTATAVTDTATLSGTNAASAGGTVTYNVYSDSGCTTLAPGGGGTAQTITTPGSLPASAAVTLSSAGPYYWGVSYSGDSSNQASSSTCGTAGEVETVSTTTVTAEPTKLKTMLVGGGSNRHRDWSDDNAKWVFAGAPVTDTARLRGANAAGATGTVTYTVYAGEEVKKNGHWSRQWVPVADANAGTVTVASGKVPNSNPVSLPSGIYEWQAVYSGDSANQPSSSRFGSETEIVIPLPSCNQQESGSIVNPSCENDETDSATQSG